ncbi:MAG: nucleotidyltransferase family protein [Candidatus Acidiferrales bacterium]
MALRGVACVILCGGLGMRLRPAVGNLPKCLAPVAGRPFLEYLLLQLRDAGVRQVTLCTGHGSREVAACVASGSRWGMSVGYSQEKEPLGTAGALKNAEGAVGSSPFLVLNGDSILDANLEQLVQFHVARGALVTLGLAHVRDEVRYGSVRTDKAGKILNFSEKREASKAAPPRYPAPAVSAAQLPLAASANSPVEELSETLVNGGVYVMDREIFSEIPPAPPAVSLETQIFPRLAGRRIFGLAQQGYFVDIGIPEDYKRAQRELPGRFASC